MPIVVQKHKGFEFTTHNDEEISDLHTGNKGTLLTDYETIKKVFGEPNTDFECGHQTDAHWTIQFLDGQVGTIYNWKNGKNYCDAYELEDIPEWEVGGKTSEVYERINKMLGLD